MTSGTLYITGDEATDGLLNANGTALLLGMLLDQQIPMERAFAGPATLHERLGHLDPVRIAAMDLEEFVGVCAAKPAIHRFPSSMGKRIHEVCTVLAEQYQGDATNIWAGVGSASELSDRLRALPGYGAEKTQIFIALLAKTQGIRPSGWEDTAGHFSDDVPKSVADIDSPETLAKVREWKQARKAAKK